MHDLFRLYRIPVKDGFVWGFTYYTGRTVKNGKAERLKASTGIRIKGRQSEKAAREDAKAFLKLDPVKKSPTLKEFAKDFFIFDHCEWIARRRSHEHNFSPAVAQSRRGHLDHYIFPAFGSYDLKTLSHMVVDIENWFSNVRDYRTGEPLANQTKNHIRVSFRIVMGDAFKKELIDLNPIKETEAFKNNPRRRDIFTDPELEKLFPADPEQLLQVWGKWYWVNFFFLSCVCGARISEVRALIPGHVRMIPKKKKNDPDRYALEISQAIKADDTIGPPKSGKPRAVEIPDRAIAMLHTFMQSSPYDAANDFIFYGRKSGAEPIGRKTVYLHFLHGLDHAKISRAGRNLVPHSFRHTYVSKMRGLYSRKLFSYMIGHEDGKTTDGYDHQDPVQRLVEYQGELE